MTNSYVDFVSDENFEKYVMKVCEAYGNFSKDLNIKELHKHGIDLFKMTFDMMNKKQDYRTWLLKEKERQNDKTVSNAVGEFHQNILGHSPGWENLGTGDDSQLDLKKKDNSVFIELKNKQNTVNDSSKEMVRKKLESAAEKHPGAKCYWAYIVANSGKPYDRVWWPYKKTKYKKNENIRVIAGTEVYKLVTGDPENLKKVLEAVPKAIKKVCKNAGTLKEKDAKEILGLFESGFDRKREKKKTKQS